MAEALPAPSFWCCSVFREGVGCQICPWRICVRSAVHRSFLQSSDHLAVLASPIPGPRAGYPDRSGLSSASHWSHLGYPRLTDSEARSVCIAEALHSRRRSRCGRSQRLGRDPRGTPPGTSSSWFATVRILVRDCGAESVEPV